MRPAPERPPDDANAMSFGEHLEELRRRLLWAILGLAPCLGIGIAIAAPGLRWIMRPVQEQLAAAGLPQKLQATGLLESFGAYVRISIVVMLVLGLPWCLAQAWRFVAPGLYAHERRFAHLLIPFSVVLSIAGVLFLYFVMLPAMLFFLVRFGSSLVEPTIATAPVAETVHLPTMPILTADPVAPKVGEMWFNLPLRELRAAIPTSSGGIEVVGADMTRSTGIVQQYRVSEYVELVFFMALAFAFGFQTPAVVLLLGWIGLVDGAFLRRQRRYAILVSAIAAALLTPSPDPFSMLLLALPLYLLYELGLVLLWLLPAHRIGAKATRESSEAGED